MQVALICSPQTAIARIILDPQEVLWAQHGSLVAMSPHLEAQTTVRRSSEAEGRLTKRVGQARSLFLNNYRAGEEGGEVYLAPALVGNIGHYQLGGHKLIVRQSSYLACGDQVDIFLGYRSPLKKTNHSWLSLVGQGEVLISAFGAIYAVEVDREEIINADHVVAFDNSLKVKEYVQAKPWPRLLVPIRESFYQFKGTGTILCQSNRPRGFAQALGRQLKPGNFRLH